MTAPIFGSIYLAFAVVIALMYLSLWERTYLPDYDRLKVLPPVFTTITKILVFILAFTVAPLAAFDLILYYFKHKEDIQK